MKVHAIYHSLAITSTLSSLATATFNLNTSGPDWDYTAKDLANTTSQACKDAYSADINCDPTLLGLVASMRPGFQPGPSDFDNTCTPTCSESLDTYVAGVQAACTAPGDKSQESVGGGDNVDMYLDPVEIVGQLFQYTFASNCAYSSNGSYCYFEPTANADSFSCDDLCAMEFYKSAHDYPASAKMFNYYYLISRGSWWASEFATGWTRLTEVCGLVGDNATSSSNSTETSQGAVTSTASSMFGAETSPASTSSTAKDQSETAASVLSSTTTSASTGSPTKSANAGESLKVEHVAGGIVWSSLMALCLL
ncbi:hypothetical protein D0Z07_4566 [Hyphodiscus hymeniophilus]|uniref:Uncharacterized protein n=1 Tax=Hyphodiscus hymeniophilus TaxID=353542 RepID=A0A9P6VKT2_9HELO|nr:hypothetical protein D0Z07_4566 [Hyphodiscus hymeniophilus]